METRPPYIRLGARPESFDLIRDGKFALGITVGVFLTVFVVLILQLSGIELSHAELVQVFPTLLALMVAIISMVVSHQALSEQRRLRQAGTDPVLMAHLAQRHDEPMVVEFRITNVGAGAALNVKIEADPLSDERIERHQILANVGLLTHPIRTIPQNTYVSYNFGLGFRLLEKDDPLPPFVVGLAYEDIDGTEYRSSHEIDVGEMNHRTANAPSLTTMAKALDRIEKTLRPISKHYIEKNKTA